MRTRSHSGRVLALLRIVHVLIAAHIRCGLHESGNFRCGGRADALWYLEAGGSLHPRKIVGGSHPPTIREPQIISHRFLEMKVGSHGYERRTCLSDIVKMEFCCQFAYGGWLRDFNCPGLPISIKDQGEYSK